MKEHIERIIDLIIIILLIFLVILVGAQVFSRYVLRNPFTWSEELARYTLIWIVFLSTAAAFRLNRHMTIDLVNYILPKRYQNTVKIISNIFIFFFLVIVLYYGIPFVHLTMSQPSAALNIPMGLIYIAFPVSALIIVMEIIHATIRYFKRKS